MPYPMYSPHRRKIWPICYIRFIWNKSILPVRLCCTTALQRTLTNPLIDCILWRFSLASTRTVKTNFKRMLHRSPAVFNACSHILDNMTRPSPIRHKRNNGLTFKICFLKKDNTAGAIVYHQVGVPTARVSKASRSISIGLMSGQYPRFVSSSPCCTTSSYVPTYGYRVSIITKGAV